MLARRRPRTRQQMMGRRSRSRVPASRARGWRHLKFGSTERKSNAPDSATLVRHSVPFRKILAGAKILVWGRVRDLEPILDRKSTRLNSVTNEHLVCRLLLEKKTTRNV